LFRSAYGLATTRALDINLDLINRVLVVLDLELLLVSLYLLKERVQILAYYDTFGMFGGRCVSVHPDAQRAPDAPDWQHALDTPDAMYGNVLRENIQESAFYPRHPLTEVREDLDSEFTPCLANAANTHAWTLQCMIPSSAEGIAKQAAQGEARLAMRS
jgi:hypothetical protein